MNSAGIYNSIGPIEEREDEEKICTRCGRKNHTNGECYESTNSNGQKLNYCTCLKCR